MTLDYAKNALKLRRPVDGTAKALDEREIAFRWANAEDPLVVVPVFVNEMGHTILRWTRVLPAL